MTKPNENVENITSLPTPEETEKVSVWSKIKSSKTARAVAIIGVATGAALGAGFIAGRTTAPSTLTDEDYEMIDAILAEEDNDTDAESA